jgi:DNA ligase-1
MKPMLLHKYSENIDPTGWDISEKLDGICAVWDGVRLTSRNEKHIWAPSWFLLALPCVTRSVVGELWAGHGKFQQTVSTVRKKYPLDEEWEKITFHIFDINMKGIWVDRAVYLASFTGGLYCKVVPHFTLKSREDMYEMYNTFIEFGGEGAVIISPDNIYRPGTRSKTALKLKPETEDTATVIGFQAGEGKYVGMMGALVCEWRGKTIEIGTGFSDFDRLNPPELYTMISFHYTHLTNDGLPKCAAYVRK